MEPRVKKKKNQNLCVLALVPPSACHHIPAQLRECARFLRFLESKTQN
jgi:hypothetical protein